MSSDSLFDVYRDATTQAPRRRRFGPVTTEERQFEVKALRAELRNLQRSNDELSGMLEGRSLESLIGDINRSKMDEHCRTIRDNLTRMSEIFARLDDLRRLGFH